VSASLSVLKLREYASPNMSLGNSLEGQSDKEFEANTEAVPRNAACPSSARQEDLSNSRPLL